MSNPSQKEASSVQQPKLSADSEEGRDDDSPAVDISQMVARIKEKNLQDQSALQVVQADIQNKVATLENDLLLNQYKIEQDLGNVDSDGAGVGLKPLPQSILKRMSDQGPQAETGVFDQSISTNQRDIIQEMIDQADKHQKRLFEHEVERDQALLPSRQHSLIDKMVIGLTPKLQSVHSWDEDHDMQVIREDDEKFAEHVAPIDLEEEQERDEYEMISGLFDFDQIRDADPNYGIKRYRNSLYKGALAKKKRHGLGVLMYANGRIYEGEWQTEKRNGRGFELFINGSKYIGQFVNNHAHGKGIYTWENGEIYDGEWNRGLKHGFGIWKGLMGDSYIGEWKKGQVQGYGVHNWKNGDKYEGEWTDCLKHGQGTDVFMNGDVYTGTYQLGKPYGFGQYKWDNQASYIGGFYQGMKHGNGKWRKDSRPNSNNYEGEFFNDMKHGKGVFTWESGNRYDGEYHNDNRAGYGEMTWKDGSAYKGQWSNGLQDGWGTLTLPNGKVREGLWKKNKFKGPGKGGGLPQIPVVEEKVEPEGDDSSSFHSGDKGGMDIVERIYDADGYDQDGYDVNGFNREGYGRDGFNLEGYDKQGYGRDGLHKDGYDSDGYDKYGFDRNGLDRNGIHRNMYRGMDIKERIYDEDGYDQDGYDVNGFNREGYGRDGFNSEGYDKYGYGRDGLHKDGYDSDGYDKYGFDRNGMNRNGIHRNMYRGKDGNYTFEVILTDEDEAPAIEDDDDLGKIQQSKTQRLERHMTDIGIGPDKEEEARIEAEQDRQRQLELERLANIEKERLQREHEALLRRGSAHEIACGPDSAAEDDEQMKMLERERNKKKKGHDFSCQMDDEFGGGANKWQPGDGSTSEFDRHGNLKKNGGEGDGSEGKKKRKKKREYVDDGKCKMHQPFNKEKSVFKDWKEDKKETADGCIDHDIKLWKLDRFCKQQPQRAAIIKLIKENFTKLNEIWLSFMARSSHYPGIGQQDISQFCKVANIISKAVTTQRIDMYFVATNVELVDQKFNDDRSLCRFEFFEILIRIAKGVYVETKQEKELPKAFERLLMEKVLPLYETVYPWQRFRADPGLYTCCVNSVFEENMERLRNLYDSAAKKSKGKLMSRDVAISLFTKNQDIDLEVVKAQQAAAASKMTVVKEGIESGMNEYKNIRFVEFLEMIARCAELKYLEEQSSSLILQKQVTCKHHPQEIVPQMPESTSILKMRPDDERFAAPLEEKIFYVIEALVAQEDKLQRCQSKILWWRLPRLAEEDEESSSEFETDLSDTERLRMETDKMEKALAKKEKKEKKKKPKPKTPIQTPTESEESSPEEEEQTPDPKEPKPKKEPKKKKEKKVKYKVAATPVETPISSESEKSEETEEDVRDMPQYPLRIKQPKEPKLKKEKKKLKENEPEVEPDIEESEKAEQSDEKSPVRESKRPKQSIKPRPEKQPDEPEPFIAPDRIDTPGASSMRSKQSERERKHAKIQKEVNDLDDACGQSEKSFKRLKIQKPKEKKAVSVKKQSSVVMKEPSEKSSSRHSSSRPTSVLESFKMMKEKKPAKLSRENKDLAEGDVQSEKSFQAIQKIKAKKIKVVAASVKEPSEVSEKVDPVVSEKDDPVASEKDDPVVSEKNESVASEKVSSRKSLSSKKSSIVQSEKSSIKAPSSHSSERPASILKSEKPQKEKKHAKFPKENKDLAQGKGKTEKKFKAIKKIKPRKLSVQDGESEKVSSKKSTPPVSRKSTPEKSDTPSEVQASETSSIKTPEDSETEESGQLIVKKKPETPKVKTPEKKPEKKVEEKKVEEPKKKPEKKPEEKKKPKEKEKKPKEKPKEPEKKPEEKPKEPEKKPDVKQEVKQEPPIEEPKSSKKSSRKSKVESQKAESSDEQSIHKTEQEPSEKSSKQPSEKSSEKPSEKSSEKPSEKISKKPTEKSSKKPSEKSIKKAQSVSQKEKSQISEVEKSEHKSIKKSDKSKNTNKEKSIPSDLGTPIRIEQKVSDKSKSSKRKSASEDPKPPTEKSDNGSQNNKGPQSVSSKKSSEKSVTPEINPEVSLKTPVKSFRSKIPPIDVSKDPTTPFIGKHGMSPLKVIDFASLPDNLTESNTDEKVSGKEGEETESHANLQQSPRSPGQKSRKTEGLAPQLRNSRKASPTDTIPSPTGTYIQKKPGTYIKIKTSPFGSRTKLTEDDMPSVRTQSNNGETPRQESPNHSPHSQILLLSSKKKITEVPKKTEPVKILDPLGSGKDSYDLATDSDVKEKHKTPGRKKKRRQNSQDSDPENQLLKQLISERKREQRNPLAKSALKKKSKDSDSNDDPFNDYKDITRNGMPPSRNKLRLQDHLRNSTKDAPSDINPLEPSDLPPRTSPRDSPTALKISHRQRVPHTSNTKKALDSEGYRVPTVADPTSSGSASVMENKQIPTQPDLLSSISGSNKRPDDLNNLLPDSPKEKVPRTSHASSQGMQEQPDNCQRPESETPSKGANFIPVKISNKGRKQKPIYASIDVNNLGKKDSQPFNKRSPFPVPRKNNLTRPESATSESYSPLDKRKPGLHLPDLKINKRSREVSDTQSSITQSVLDELGDGHLSLSGQDAMRKYLGGDAFSNLDRQRNSRISRIKNQTVLESERKPSRMSVAPTFLNQHPLLHNIQDLDIFEPEEKPSKRGKKKLQTARMASQLAIDILMKGMKKKERHPYWVPAAAPLISHHERARISPRDQIEVMKIRKRSRY